MFQRTLQHYIVTIGGIATMTAIGYLFYGRRWATEADHIAQSARKITVRDITATTSEGNVSSRLK